MTGGLILIALDGPGAPASAPASAPTPGAPPVRVVATTTRQAAILADDRVTAELILRSGGRLPVRTQIVVRRDGEPDVVVGRPRTVTLSASRPRRVELPLTAAGRRAVAACAPARIAVVVRTRAFERARTSTIPLRTDPPDCARFFGQGAFWNSALAADAPLDPESDAITEELRRQVRAGFDAGPKPTINTTSYAPPIYTVGPRQSVVRVGLDRPPGYAPDLEAAFAAVPLPADARPSAGDDGELVVWQPSTDTMWEFWQLRRRGDGWQASWGGRMEQVSDSSGVYTHPRANWGTTASGLALVGGVITPAELRRGQVDHALAIGIPRTRSGEFSLPAQRTDGDSTCPHAVPEGARFRLDPVLDVDALGLAPPVAAMARAAQRYGIVVRDQSAAVAFYAQNPTPFGVDPYPELLGGKAPWELLATFPWQHLRLLRMDLVKTPGDGQQLPQPQEVLGGCG